MKNLCSEVIAALEGKTLVTAESLTGGGIGAALTAVPGASAVYKGGVISYCDEIKEKLLNVKTYTLKQFGAVSSPVAGQMAEGGRTLMDADIAVSVTGLAGPGGDDHGLEVGTVYIGFSSEAYNVVRECHFSGSRDEVRRQTIQAALELILEMV